MKAFGKCIRIFLITILSIILIFNLIIVIKSVTNQDEIPGLFGYKPFIVMSGSMETNISVGDLVIVKETSPEELEIGDIIAFKEDENVITHRITEKSNDNNRLIFKTKGDANNTEDKGYVIAEQIEGKFVRKISKLGSIILVIQEPLGFTVMILSILIICLSFYTFGNKKKNISNEMTKEELAEFEEFKKQKAKDDK